MLTCERKYTEFTNKCTRKFWIWWKKSTKTTSKFSIKTRGISGQQHASSFSFWGRVKYVAGLHLMGYVKYMSSFSLMKSSTPISIVKCFTIVLINLYVTGTVENLHYWILFITFSVRNERRNWEKHQNKCFTSMLIYRYFKWYTQLLLPAFKWCIQLSLVCVVSI